MSNIRLRLVETYDPVWDSTSYRVERQPRSVLWWDREWKLMGSYSDRAIAQGLFERLKKSRGELQRRTVLEEWP